MPPGSSVVPALPGDPEARIAWATRYRERFKRYWGKDGGFVNKAVAVRWALSHLDRFQQLTLKDFFAELRTFINVELRIDNACPENLLGPAGT